MASFSQKEERMGAKERGLFFPVSEKSLFRLLYTCHENTLGAFLAPISPILVEKEENRLVIKLVQQSVGSSGGRHRCCKESTPISMFAKKNTDFKTISSSIGIFTVSR